MKKLIFLLILMYFSKFFANTSDINPLNSDNIFQKYIAIYYNQTYQQIKKNPEDFSLGILHYIPTQNRYGVLFNINHISNTNLDYSEIKVGSYKYFNPIISLGLEMGSGYNSIHKQSGISFQMNGLFKPIGNLNLLFSHKISHISTYENFSELHLITKLNRNLEIKNTYDTDNNFRSSILFKYAYFELDLGTQFNRLTYSDYSGFVNISLRTPKNKINVKHRQNKGTLRKSGFEYFHFIETMQPHIEFPNISKITIKNKVANSNVVIMPVIKPYLINETEINPNCQVENDSLVCFDNVFFNSNSKMINKPNIKNKLVAKLLTKINKFTPTSNSNNIRANTAFIYSSLCSTTLSEISLPSNQRINNKYVLTNWALLYLELGNKELADFYMKNAHIVDQTDLNIAWNMELVNFFKQNSTRDKKNDPSKTDFIFSQPKPEWFYKYFKYEK